jgi:hypothetical protein
MKIGLIEDLRKVMHSRRQRKLGGYTLCVEDLESTEGEGVDFLTELLDLMGWSQTHVQRRRRRERVILIMVLMMF